MWYLRYFVHRTRATGGKPFWVVKICSAFDVAKATGKEPRCDLVLLDDGRVARHDYKKPLPEWLQDPLIRQMVAATGKVPGVDKSPAKA